MLHQCHRDTPITHTSILCLYIFCIHICSISTQLYSYNIARNGQGEFSPYVRLLCIKYTYLHSASMAISSSSGGIKQQQYTVKSTQLLFKNLPNQLCSSVIHQPYIFINAYEYNIKIFICICM